MTVCCQSVPVVWISITLVQCTQNVTISVQITLTWYIFLNIFYNLKIEVFQVMMLCQLDFSDCEDVGSKLFKKISYQTTWCHIQEVLNLSRHCCKNLKHHTSQAYSYRINQNYVSWYLRYSVLEILPFASTIYLWLTSWHVWDVLYVTTASRKIRIPVPVTYYEQASSQIAHTKIS